jgi:hypothetical protein
MKLLLQARIRGCDGSLAVQSFDILHEYASGLHVSECPSFDLAQDGEPVEPSHFASVRFRNKPS